MTPTVKQILILNFVCFLLFNFFPFSATSLLYDKMALHLFNSESFIPTQYITYLFLHADFVHFLTNMMGLLVFGSLLESIWGAKRFWIFYLVTGIGGGIVFSLVRYAEHYELFMAINNFLSNPSPELFDTLSRKYYMFDKSFDYSNLVNNYYLHPKEHSQYSHIVFQWKEMIAGGICVGASGAIFGLLFAFAYYFPNTELMLLFVPVPIKAKYFVLLYGAYELFVGINKIQGDNVAHWGHLGGILFAYILILIWQKSRKSLY